MLQEGPVFLRELRLRLSKRFPCSSAHLAAFWAVGDLGTMPGPFPGSSPGHAGPLGSRSGNGEQLPALPAHLLPSLAGGQDGGLGKCEDSVAPALGKQPGAAGAGPGRGTRVGRRFGSFLSARLRAGEGLASLGSCSLINPLETALEKLRWPSTPAGSGPPFQGFSLITLFASGVTFLGEGNVELFP